MNPFLSAVITSPAAPFIALSAVWFAVEKARRRPSGKLTAPVLWGLFAFITTHLATEAWNLGGDLRQMVDLFTLGLLYIAIIYAFLSDRTLLKLALVGSVAAIALIAIDPGVIRFAWLALAVLRVVYCWEIFDRVEGPARGIWGILLVVHAITVGEQIDCQMIPGFDRPFEEGAACTYVNTPIMGVDFHLWLYGIYTLPLIWILYRAYTSRV